jgi:hypothetical protein
MKIKRSLSQNMEHKDCFGKRFQWKNQVVAMELDCATRRKPAGPCPLKIVAAQMAGYIQNFANKI